MTNALSMKYKLKSPTGLNSKNQEKLSIEFFKIFFVFIISSIAFYE